MRLRQVVHKALRRVGYDIRQVRLDETNSGLPQERLFPAATYAPWCADPVFQETFEQIAGNTLVDQYRCYELWQLIQEVSSTEGAILEVGVWRGGTGALIARRIGMFAPGTRVYLCDTFSGVVKASDADVGYVNGEHADTSREVVTRLCARLGITNAAVLEGVFPDETARYVQESQIRFCHIDVDVYQSAKDVLDWVWPRLSHGGVVVFDDYGFSGCSGITRLVNSHRNSGDRVVVYNLNAHAVMVKL